MVAGSLKPKLLLSFTVAICASLLNATLDASCAAWAKGKPAKTTGADTTAADPAAPLKSAPAVKDSAPQVVHLFEQRLFFKNYVDDPLPARLARIEKQVFGQALESSQEDRLARLEEILKTKEAEEQKAKEAEDYRAATAAPPKPAANPQDEVDRARASIQQAREDEIAGLLADGVNLYRKKQGMQAQEKFEQVLRLDPTNAQAHFNLGIIEETMGNFVEALGSYKQAMQREPDNSEYVEAVKAIEKKASAQANSLGKRADLRALAEQANAAWKRGEYISALDLYQQLDQKEPNRALVKYNIGSIFLMLKDPNSALDFYRQAAKIAPDEPKYTKAFNDLNNEVKKGDREQEKVQKEADKDWAEAHNEAPEKPGKKSKGKGTGTASGGGQPSYPQARPQQQQQQQTSGGYQQQRQQPQQQMGGGYPQQQQQQMGGGYPQQRQPQQPQQQMGGGYPQQRPQQQMGGGYPQQRLPQQQLDGNYPQQRQQQQMGGGYPPQQQMGGGYPQQQQMGGGYPQQQQMGGYPPQQQMGGGYPPQQQMGGGYPPQQQQMGGGGYPPQQQMGGGYPPQQQMGGGYPPQQQQMGGGQRTAYSGSPQQPQQQQLPSRMNPTELAGSDMMAQFGIVGKSNGEGVTVVKVGSSSRAASAGLAAGDDIKAVDGIEVSGKEALLDVLSRINPAKRIPFLIMRNGNLAVLNL